MSLRENLTTDSVSQLQPAEVLRVAADDSIADAIKLMREHRAGSVIVCDGKNHLVGIFTERDVLRIIAEEGDLTAPVASVMTAEPATISSTSTIAQAVLQMHRGGYRRLPVLDDQGLPTSVVKLRSVIHYLVEHFPSSVYNLPPVSRPMTRDREGA